MKKDLLPITARDKEESAINIDREDGQRYIQKIHSLITLDLQLPHTLLQDTALPFSGAFYR